MTLLPMTPTHLLANPGDRRSLCGAKDLGRKAIGIEISERYCEIAAKRMGQEVFDFAGAPPTQNASETR